MRTRIISAAVGLAVLGVVILLGREAIGAAVFLLAVFGVHEFYMALENKGYKPLKAIGYLCCLPLLYIGISGGQTFQIRSLDVLFSLKGIALCIFMLMVVLFCFVILTSGKYNLIDIAVTSFGILYVVFLFAFVIRTRNLENGQIYFCMILIGAWITDTFAYFTGVTIGKTKILPYISPNKSLEGSIGGIVGCIAAMAVYWLIVGKYLQDVSVYDFIIMGTLCGIVSQIGDWAASAVKRFANIKDYGTVMPGHGGVLDRCDSILFVAPVVYFYISMVIH